MWVWLGVAIKFHLASWWRIWFSRCVSLGQTFATSIRINKSIIMVVKIISYSLFIQLLENRSCRFFYDSFPYRAPRQKSCPVVYLHCDKDDAVLRTQLRRIRLKTEAEGSNKKMNVLLLRLVPQTSEGTSVSTISSLGDCIYSQSSWLYNIVSTDALWHWLVSQNLLQ